MKTASPVEVKPAVLEPVSGLEFPSYYFKVLRSITKKQVITPPVNYYQYETRFQIAKSFFRAWAQTYNLQRHQLPAVLTYYARISRDYLFQVLTDLGVNFANIMHLGVDTELLHTPFRFLPNQTYHYSGRLNNIALLGKGRAVLDFVLDIYDSYGNHVLQHSDKMFLKNVQEADAAKLAKLQSSQEDYSSYMGLSNRKSQLLTQPAPSILPIQLQPNTGFQYGKASGDLNPLHTSHLFSRLTGHRTSFVQGLYTTNLVFKILHRDLNTPVKGLSIKFSRPIYSDTPAFFVHKDTEFEFVDLDFRVLAFGHWTEP